MKIFKDNSYKNHGRTLGWGAGPDNDWHIIFIIFLLLIVLAAGYPVREFSQIKAENATAVVGSEQTLIDSNILRRASDDFRTRIQNFETVKSQSDTSADPSK